MSARDNAWRPWPIRPTENASPRAAGAASSKSGMQRPGPKHGGPAVRREAADDHFHRRELRFRPGLLPRWQAPRDAASTIATASSRSGTARRERCCEDASGRHTPTPCSAWPIPGRQAAAFRFLRSHRDSLGPGIGRERKSFKGHESWVYSAAFAPPAKEGEKETRIVTASQDGTVMVWSIATQKARTCPSKAIRPRLCRPLLARRPVRRLGRLRQAGPALETGGRQAVRLRGLPDRS